MRGMLFPMALLFHVAIGAPPNAQEGHSRVAYQVEREGRQAGQSQDQFCCCLKEGQECPTADYSVRQDDVFAVCENGNPKCCYDSESSYETISDDITSVCPPDSNDSKFCCHLKADEECPSLDLGVRGGDLTDNDGECCYDSRSVYDAIPDIQSVCPAEIGQENGKETKKCCCLKEGSECPVEDLGVRQDDLLEEESCPDGQERCCHYSQSFFNNIANICEQTYNTIVDASTNNCTDHADQGYQCVPRINCDLDVGEIIVDGGPGIFTIRNDDLGELPLFEMDFENSKCRGASEVCCRHPDGLPPPSTEITTRPKVTKAKPDKKHPCGRRNKNGIRGGTSIGGLGTGGAQYGEWPWTCQVIQKANTGKSIPLGGATLIDEGIVLTYGTKVVGIDLNTIFVRCGDWDIRGDIEPLAVQEKGVYEVRIHPAYPRKPRRKDTTRAQFQDNIALLFVTEDFETGHNVDKVCLPSSVNSYNRTSCFATGWGKDKFDGEYQRIMKQVELNIVADNKCQDDLRDAIPSNNFILDQSFICAGGIPSAPGQNQQWGEFTILTTLSQVQTTLDFTNYFFPSSVQSSRKSRELEDWRSFPIISR